MCVYMITMQLYCNRFPLHGLGLIYDFYTLRRLRVEMCLLLVREGRLCVTSSLLTNGARCLSVRVVRAARDARQLDGIYCCVGGDRLSEFIYRPRVVAAVGSGRMVGLLYICVAFRGSLMHMGGQARVIRGAEIQFSLWCWASVLGGDGALCCPLPLLMPPMLRALCLPDPVESQLCPCATKRLR